jgi:hypothetical protein
MTDLMEQFRKDWAQEREMAQLCARLFEYLSVERNRLEHFNFSHLKKISPIQDDIKLSKALQYLSSPRCQVLSQIFLFFDDNEVYEFSPEDMAEIYSAAAFSHPRSGDVITDLNEIAVAFEPGQYLRNRVNN